MRVGFAGIGSMGWPMAANLARKGFDLTVFDVDAGRSREFAETIGGRPGTLAALAGCDCVIAMLPTGAHVRELLLEQDGSAFLQANPKAIVVDMSSSEPAGTRSLGTELAKHGVIFLDAPVSGAVPRAETATLAIMVGGEDDEAIARVEPVLRAMGDRIFRTGPLGSGHATKALNNFLAGAGLAAASEALTIGRRFGLDPETLIDIVNVSTGRNFATEALMKQHVLSGAFSSGFSLGLLAKDVGIAAGLARDLGIDAPVTALVSARFDEARDKLGPGVDNSALIKAWDDSI